VSEMDDTFAQVDADLFEDYGQDAIAQRGAGPETPVRVIVDRGVKLYGEFGQLVGLVDKVSFRNVQWQPREGDVLTLSSVVRRVDRLEADDGSVSVAVLHG
jgi:hypothetical protein